ncbi:MAG: hypothetical protein AB7O65_04945 [Candidatus Korobacteraceae bacterium]
MLFDILRLAVGVVLAMLHRPIADFVLSQEYALAGLFRQRGIPVPAPPTTEVFRDVYFTLGILLALVSMARIWYTLNPQGILATVTLSLGY